MSRYVRISLDELIGARVKLNGMAFFFLAPEDFYVDLRRLRREIRRAELSAKFMSDLTPFNWQRLARRFGVRLSPSAKK